MADEPLLWKVPDREELAQLLGAFNTIPYDWVDDITRMQSVLSNRSGEKLTHSDIVTLILAALQDADIKSDYWFVFSLIYHLVEDRDVARAAFAYYSTMMGRVPPQKATDYLYTKRPSQSQIMVRLDQVRGLDSAGILVYRLNNSADSDEEMGIERAVEWVTRAMSAAGILFRDTIVEDILVALFSHDVLFGYYAKEHYIQVRAEAMGWETEG